MIKTALESKYIRIALAILAAIIVIGAVLIETVGKERSAMVDDGTYRFSLFAPKNVEILHKSGKYTLVGDGEWYYIEDEQGKILYEDENEPTMLEREGYIRVRNEDGKTCLINIYTGENVWKAKGEEHIDNYWDGFWVVEDTVKKEDSVFSDVIFYLLDDNFEVAADGVMFNYIDGNDEYIMGQRFINYTYYNRNELKGKDLFASDTDNAVLKDGKEYYVSEGQIDHLDGDTAHMSNMAEGRKTHISLLPETLGEEMRGECYEDDR